MRTPIDALRSVKRYVAVALGEEWEVRLDREEGAITLPFASVGFAGPSQTSGPAWETLMTQPVNIWLTPVPGTNGMEAQENAGKIEDSLWQAFRTGVGLGKPLRIPLYDYAGVAANQGSEKRAYPDYLRVTDFQITQNADADDVRRVMVNAELRVTWRRMGPVPSSTKTVASLKDKFTTS